MTSKDHFYAAPSAVLSSIAVGAEKHHPKNAPMPPMSWPP